MQSDATTQKVFSAHAPMPKNHGYGNTHRNAAEAKWRANQQEKQQKAVAKQLGLQLPDSQHKKRNYPEPDIALVPEDSEEQKRIRAWSEYYAAMALEEGRTHEERTQAEAWAKYYADQLRATSSGGQPGASGSELGEAAASVGLSSSERKRAKAAAAASSLKLLAAVVEGNSQAVRQQIAHGVSVDMTDEEGTPLVVLASKLNHPAILKELLAASDDVDGMDRGGFTALHYACIENRIKLIRMLLDCGADPLLKTKAGDAPIMLVHPSQKMIRTLVGDAAQARFAH